MGLNSNVVIITSGVGNKIFMEKFAKLIRNVFEGEITLITTGDFYLDSENFEGIKIKNIRVPYSSTPFGRIKSYLLSQFLIARNIPEDSEFFLFFLGQSLIIPLLKLKILKKKTCLILGSSDYHLSKTKGGLTFFLPLLERFAFKIADYIFLYSDSLKKECNLQGYEKKVKIVHRHFLDFRKFNCFKPYDDREKIVGFIGRLSNEKGIINFVESMPEILKKDPEIQFLIIGDGILKSEIIKLIDVLKLTQKVKIIPKVKFKEIPQYLNDMKLIILPSYTEGLPNVVIEAMACGTPVLANPIGAVPDIIANEKTGFLLENNSSICIAEGVLTSLNHENMNKIIENSIKYVRNNFEFQRVSEEYEKIFKSFSD